MPRTVNQPASTPRSSTRTATADEGIEKSAAAYSAAPTSADIDTAA
jgi:hypothetical protein